MNEVAGDLLGEVHNCVWSWHIVRQWRSSPWRPGHTGAGRKRDLWRRGWAEESGPPEESPPRVCRWSLVSMYDEAGLLGLFGSRLLGSWLSTSENFEQSFSIGPDLSPVDGALESWRCDVH